MEFGVPKIRHEKVEKYPHSGVFTFLPTGDGKARKVELNLKAIEMLGIEGANNKISFSFSGRKIYVVNTSTSENVPGLRIGKTTNSFSDKKHYDYVKKMFNSGENEELELIVGLTENEFNDSPIYELSLFPAQSIVEKTFESSMNTADENLNEESVSLNTTYDDEIEIVQTIEENTIEL